MHLHDRYGSGLANALLTHPEVAPNLVVFNLTVSSYGYNGKDAWSPTVVAKRTRLVEWATGTFWDRNSVFTSKHFDTLPKNAFCDDMRRLIRSGLGQANQLGDGAALVWLWRNECWKGVKLRKAVWRGSFVRFEEIKPGETADVLDIPKQATDLRASREEFFRVLTRPELFPLAPRVKSRLEKPRHERSPARLEIPPFDPAGPAWSHNLPVYEINPRQFTSEGTFKAVERHLSRLKALGVGILWFMPIHPSGDEKSFGSFYCVRDFKEVNPDYGTKQDFKNLVSAIHDHGMFVLMDWVPHHSAFDNPLTEQHPEWYRRDKNGQIKSARGWRDVAWFDFSRRGLWKYHRDAMLYWINEFGVDGFRCDVAWGVPIEFWNWLRPELNTKAQREIFMLAEANEARHHPAFEMTYDWNLPEVMWGIVKGEKTPNDVLEMLRREQSEYPRGAIRMRFIYNHDYNWNWLLEDRYGGGAKAFAVLTATLPGRPLILNGEEVGLNRRLPGSSRGRRAPIEWKDHSLTDFYARLFRLYRENPALHRGGFRSIAATNADQVFAYERMKGNRSVVVVLNLSAERIDLRLQDGLPEGGYHELFRNETLRMRNGITLHLGPWAYRVYVRG